MGADWRRIRRHVPALHTANQGRQGASLLEHCREQSAVPAAGWCSSRCCISARSTTASMQAWCREIEAFDEGTAGAHRQLALFPADRAVARPRQGSWVQVRLGAMQLHRPRQWGACWLACQLYEQLELDRFWAPRLAGLRAKAPAGAHAADAGVLPADRSGQRVAAAPAVVRAERDGGSARRPISRWSEKNTLYRCLDKLLAHKEALFSHLRERWQDLFGAALRCAALRPDQHLLRVVRRPRTRLTSAGTATAATSAPIACRW